MFLIRMAGLTVQINNHFPYVRALCEEYVVQDGVPDLAVSASKEEILQEMARSEWGGVPALCEALCIYRNICLQLPRFGAFLMHGAAVAVDGHAYLFLAKSGVGKSTHAQLWLDAFGERAVMVNGDKPILRRFDGVWHVCGTPWRGKEGLGANVHLPLKALCFVERAEVNAIAPIPQPQAIDRVVHQILLPRDEEQLTAFFTLLSDLLQRVPCWQLGCNRQPQAAQVAYRAMSRE